MHNNVSSEIRKARVLDFGPMPKKEWDRLGLSELRLDEPVVLYRRSSAGRRACRKKKIWEVNEQTRLMETKVLSFTVPAEYLGISLLTRPK